MTPEQLKASILQRAMEGKLVLQDPNDEPASELLKRIKAEKERLIAVGKIKRDKKETELFRGDDGKPYEKLADGTVWEVEVPYTIPESWEWVRVKSIYWNLGQEKPTKTFKYIDTSAIDNNKHVIAYDNLKTLKSHQAPSRARKLVSNQSVLFSTIRPYLKNIAIVTDTTDYLIASTAFIVLNTLLYAPYLKYFLLSDNFIRCVNERSTGTSYPAINDTNFNSLSVAVPPFAEQKRIVAQIERALEKVDVYAESYNKLQELDKSFPDKLKKSILQYAMQGKLVAQDPNDDPVEILLEKIKAEKQKLYEAGKLKKKDLADIVVAKGDDNSPYGKIPRHWGILPVKDLFLITTGLSYKKTDLSIHQKGVRIIRGGNIEPLAYKLLDNDYYIEPKYIISETVYLKRNQLVTPVSTSLEHVGKFARIDKNYTDTVAGGFVFQLTPFISSDTLSNYLLLCLSSPLFYKQLKSITKLSGQALYNIPKTKLDDLLISLAPQQEQERISSKVEQLFQKVNQL